MTDQEKPNWGNRIILLIFMVLALITIAGTIFSTMSEWQAGDVAGPPAVEDLPTIDPGEQPTTAPTPEEAQ